MIDTWSNKPLSVQQCNVDQMAQIMDFIISTRDLELTEQKLRIMQYIKQNRINGDSFYKLDMTNVRKYLNVSVLKESFKPLLRSLYTVITKYDVKTFFEDKNTENKIWNAYIDKHEQEPFNMDKLHNFANGPNNPYDSVSFQIATKIYRRNKGKGKIEIKQEEKQSSSILNSSDDIELKKQNQEAGELLASNKPQSIEDCTLDQIVEIVRHEIETDYFELNEEKQHILQYIINMKQYINNGKELFAMKQRHFVNGIAEYVIQLKENKMRTLLETLRVQVLECDVSIFAMIKVDEIVEMYLIMKNIMKDDQFRQLWSKLRKDNSTDLDAITYFYALVFANSIKQSYQINTAMLTGFNSLATVLDEFLETGIIPALQATNSHTQNSMVHLIQNMFSVEFNAAIQVTEIKMLFVEFAIKIIKQKLYSNNAKYIQSSQNTRAAPFIAIAESKIDMPSVKQFKASWYQGKNQLHKIYPNQKIEKPHVFALVLYTHCTDLCTAFR
eukprot:408564_1